LLHDVKTTKNTSIAPADFLPSDRGHAPTGNGHTFIQNTYHTRPSQSPSMSKTHHTYCTFRSYPHHQSSGKYTRACRDELSCTSCRRSRNRSWLGNTASDCISRRLYRSRRHTSRGRGIRSTPSNPDRRSSRSRSYSTKEVWYYSHCKALLWFVRREARESIRPRIMTRQTGKHTYAGASATGRADDGKRLPIIIESMRTASTNMV